MKKIKIIAAYPLLFFIDLGIFLTIGGHWKTIRRYTNNKLKQNCIDAQRYTNQRSVANVDAMKN